MVRQRQTRLVTGPCIVEIDWIVIRDVQYQFEVNRCSNEEIKIPNSANSVGGDSGQDRRTDRQRRNPHNRFQNLNPKLKKIVARSDGRTDDGDRIIPTFSPKSVGILSIM
ncbi:hypothetical protein DPMN_157103 [Dreissena polymorpha]|uniref:Uncharacterized protein n=1 Tax=Dreissena polymorpha TaxID=45954 RepID=A0A9D4INJ9_DREPO|nr:hypothetical protein DPMN_157103 [Dreissena polymorpha]